MFNTPGSAGLPGGADKAHVASAHCAGTPRHWDIGSVGRLLHTGVHLWVKQLPAARHPTFQRGSQVAAGSSQPSPYPRVHIVGSGRGIPSYVMNKVSTRVGKSGYIWTDFNFCELQQ